VFLQGSYMRILQHAAVHDQEWKVVYTGVAAMI
jgi:hypothetical protein